MGRGAQLREAFAAPGAALMALVGDAQTARLAEMAGYAAASLGTAPVTNGLLGLPDAGLLTLTEMEFVASRAADACEIPILVGAETGYGNAVNMYRAIKTLDRAGVSGAFIEDKVHPAVAPSGGPSISTDEMVGKIHAAADARVDGSFVLIARTDAALSQGIDAAIERGHRYIEAGADALFLVGVPLDQRARAIAEIPEAFHVAVLGEFNSFGDLDALGYSAVLTNHAATHAGALETFRCLERIRDTGLSGDVEWKRDAAGTPLEGWESGDHGHVSRFDATETFQRYIPADAST